MSDHDSELRDWETHYVDGQTPWDTGQPSTELQRILREYQITPCRVLELGSGTGTNAIYLAQSGFDVTAIELAPTAVTRAREKGEHAGVGVNFLQGDLLAPPDFGKPYPFVFDRGVYHALRDVNIDAFQQLLERVTVPGGWYLTLAGNPNDPDADKGGPPRVGVEEMHRELSPGFDLVQLREFKFDAIQFDGVEFRPWGWSALWRRKGATEPITAQ